MRIGVFGHYGNGNLGDEAITEATVSSARRILGASEIRLYSIVPADSAFRHNLDSYPIRRGVAPVRAGETVESHRSQQPIPSTKHSDTAGHHSALREWLKGSSLVRRIVNVARSVVSLPGRIARECGFLFSSLQSLKELDLMIVAGSNQYLDNFGGIMGFPYTLLKWTVLCRLRGVKVVFLSIGAGPIQHSVSRAMIQTAIRLGYFHSYRDEDSLHLVEGSEARLGGSVYPDLACNLEFPETAIDYSSGPAIVAINPMPVYGDYWFIKDEARYKKYLTVLADFIVYLNGRGCQVILFPTQTRDMDAINDLVSIMEEMAASVVPKLRIETTFASQDVMRVIQSAHVVVPTRFHGAVLGLLAQRLVIGVCYQSKAAAVMAAAQQQNYAFMLDDIRVQDLVDAFDQLWQDRSSAIEKIREQSKQVRKEIESQYQYILTLLD